MRDFASVKKFNDRNPRTGEMEWTSYKITHTKVIYPFV